VNTPQATVPKAVTTNTLDADVNIIVVSIVFRQKKTNQGVLTLTANVLKAA